MLKRSLLILGVWISILLFWTLPSLAEMIVDTAWVRRYNGSGNGWDRPFSMVVDTFGNVYVTGGSAGEMTLSDYATIKYYKNGDTAWVRRYNGPGNGNDYAFDIAIDDSESVYVTGSSLGDGTDFDCATIKYYPNGETAWIRRYNGPANASDLGAHIALDNSGNIYVSGLRDASSTHADWVTIKYYPNGDTAWVRHYSGPANFLDGVAGMTINDLGNIYVAGGSYGNGTDVDYTTIKYYSNGDTAWIRRYNAPGNGPDECSGIALDDSGDIYVTGQNTGSGTIWDYVTVKYYSNGDTAWVRRYDWYGHWDKASSIVVDDLANVCVTGYSIGSGTGYDYATIKYRADGDTVWVRRYNGPDNSQDFALDLVADHIGNVYVTGYSYLIFPNCDYVTIKYYSNGDTAWVRTYNGPKDSTDYLSLVALDDSSNIYVTGTSYGIGTNFDYATIKYFQALRGDVNRDGVIDVVDLVYLIKYLFLSGPSPKPLETGNTNCDGVVNIVDVVFLINYLYIGGPPPSCW